MTFRSSARSTFAWAFGICLSIMFVSLWGRAVVADTDGLGESLAPLGRSEALGDIVADWMAHELTGSGVAPEMADPAVEYILDSPSVERALDGLVGEMVEAAASADPDGAAVDMRALMLPAASDVSEGLAGLGYPVADSEIRDAIEDLDPLVIRRPGSPTILGPESPAASRLGMASLIAAFGLISFGGITTYLSEDRLQALRSLLNRIAVGGLSFAVLFRLGSWVADPRGGRAPVSETVSNLAGSNLGLPLQVGLVSALVGVVVYFVRRYVRRGEASPTPSEPATPRPEPAGSRSGSH